MKKVDIANASDYSRQLHLPVFPTVGMPLGDTCSVVRREDTVWYFIYDMPVFSHSADDQSSFRMFTSSLCNQGHCKLVDIERTFNVTPISVKRALKKFREEGVESFFVKKQTVRSSPVLTKQVSAEVQELLDNGLSPREIEDSKGIKADTIRRAIQAGRLHRAHIQKKRFSTRTFRRR